MNGSMASRLRPRAEEAGEGGAQLGEPGGVVDPEDGADDDVEGDRLELLAEREGAVAGPAGDPLRGDPGDQRP